MLMTYPDFCTEMTAARTAPGTAKGFDALNSFEVAEVFAKVDSRDLNRYLNIYYGELKGAPLDGEIDFIEGWTGLTATPTYTFAA